MRAISIDWVLYKYVYYYYKQLVYESGFCVTGPRFGSATTREDGRPGFPASQRKENQRAREVCINQAYVLVKGFCHCIRIIYNG